ncbi:hypothetical protein [Komagataeibacter oboediens]|uniref:Uncharacterized protein n=1 Tax=Komagataeibacter oboediens TaxID=65958 RepID=A0ABS5SP69_9PROT|nr:hypothetical protein [Komagataeibacter oboediens]MBL7232661.1 hypothetical protein [Komagataeibacter oboediens]MBT0676067.1 hypothetical protein [Komagataeibacter oboediens]MBT0679630.1 hypothetical protein [Komagataeibacter oboediens]
MVVSPLHAWVRGAPWRPVLPVRQAVSPPGGGVGRDGVFMKGNDPWRG